MSFPSEILAPAQNDQVVPTTLITAASSTRESLSATSAPSPPVTSAAKASRSAKASALDPPTIAGLTIGALVAAVVTFCVVGCFVHWLHKRRDAKNRTLAQQTSGRWGPNNPEHPPDGDAVFGGKQKPEVFTAYPKMVDSPTAGYRVDPSQIGMAVSEDTQKQTAPAPFQSVSSLAPLVTNAQQMSTLPNWGTAEQQNGPMSPGFSSSQEVQPQSGGGISKFVSSLRPRAPPPPQPSHRRSPPPLDIPLNHSGAHLIGSCAPPKRERQTLERSASNAQAQSNPIPAKPNEHKRKITPDDLMKPLPDPRSQVSSAFDLETPSPCYVIDDYYTRNSPASPPQQLQSSQRHCRTATSSMAYVHPESMVSSSPTVSAVPSSNLEGPSVSTRSARHPPHGLGIPRTTQGGHSPSRATRLSEISVTSAADFSENASVSEAFPEENDDDIIYVSPRFSPTSGSPLSARQYQRMSHSSTSQQNFRRTTPPVNVDNQLEPYTPALSSARTPMSASSSISTPRSTSIPSFQAYQPRQRRPSVKRTNTSPAYAGISDTAVMPLSPMHQYPQTGGLDYFFAESGDREGLSIDTDVGALCRTYSHRKHATTTTTVTSSSPALKATSSRRKTHTKTTSTSTSTTITSATHASPVMSKRNRQSRNPSDSSISPQYTCDTIPSPLSRSIPTTPWSAGCGAVQVVLRSPSWSPLSGDGGRCGPVGVC